MSVNILSDGAITCFYCNTTMVAFGPIMDSEEHAEAFYTWLQVERDFKDPRAVPVSALIGVLWPKFFEEIWPDRLCEKCDMYNEETTGALCEECK